MAFKKAIANVLKELIIPELSKIKVDLNNLNVKVEFTNKRLDDINAQLMDQSRRLDETNNRIDETNNRINRLYEVIVHRDEHSDLAHRFMELEKDVREIKIKIAV